MAKKKKSKLLSYIEDAVGSSASDVIKAVAKPVVKRIGQEAAKKLGADSLSSRDQIALNREKLKMEKEQIELAKARAQQLKAEEQLKLTEIKVAERELQLEKTRQQSGQISIEKTELDLHVKTEVISGTLNMVADSGGFSVPDENKEACQEWLANLPGSVGLIPGKRGTGKSAAGCAIGESLQATYGTPFYWLGIPEKAQEYLPSFVRIVDSLEQCPNDCFILVDEGGFNFLSLKYADKRNVYLRQQLMLCRQKNWTVVFCFQSSRDVDESVIRQSNWILFKEPALNAATSERPELRAQALKASQIFKQIPKEDRIRFGYVFGEYFEGIIQCSLPSFWSEELSNIYGRSSQLNTVGRKGNLQPINLKPGKIPKLSYADVSDEQILELRRGGDGYDTISKKLNCSNYRVRMCLAGNDPLANS
ncbi:hypothetical protein ACFLUG_03150 [Chloroflexota bacterium]